MDDEGHWFIVHGGVATLDGRDRMVEGGDAVDVGVRVPHRIHKIGDTELVFVEVQHGEHFGEDDIVRLKDDYGR